MKNKTQKTIKASHFVKKIIKDKPELKENKQFTKTLQEVVKIKPKKEK